MKLLSSSLLFVGSLGLVFLGACSNGTQVTNPKTIRLLHLQKRRVRLLVSLVRIKVIR